MNLNRFRPLALAAALLAAGIAEAAAPEAPAPGLTLHYRATLAGLQVGTAAATIAGEGADYRLDGELRTEGPLTLLLPWSYRVVAAGRIGEDGPQPARFWGAGEYKGEPRHIQVSFDGAGATIDSAEPHPAEKPKRLVPPELRRGTLDPLSALLALGRQVGRDGRCDRQVRVFDGRHRFDLHLAEDAGAGVRAASAAGGPQGAVRCRFFYEPIAGFKEDHRPYAAAADNPGTVWFQRLRPGWPAMPVRVEAQSSYGRFVMELTSAADRSVAQR